MLDYTGVKCPVCETPFRKDDDIVVCPECGAPYHRECYHQAGKCIFDDLHEEGREWQPPAPPKAPDPTAEIKDRECPVCGTLNGRSTLFCSRCGASLLGGPGAYRNPIPPAQGSGNVPPPPVSPYGGSRFTGAVPPFAYDPMGGVSPAEILDTNVTFGDASKLVKQNTNYYMPVFRYIKQSGRNKFNFSAFLFTGAWMLYRKQYKYGAIVTAIMFLLQIAQLLVTAFVSAPALNALAQAAGIDLSSTLYLTQEQYAMISAQMMQDSANAFRMMLSMLCPALSLAVMIVVGLRGNKMYLKHCIRTVQEVKSMQGDGDPSMTMEAKCGVNTMAVLCIALCYFIVKTFFPLIL